MVALSGQEIKLIDNVEVVPSGVIHIIHRQEQGWSTANRSTLPAPGRHQKNRFGFRLSVAGEASGTHRAWVTVICRSGGVGHRQG